MDSRAKTSLTEPETRAARSTDSTDAASTEAVRDKPPGANFYGDQDESGVDRSLLRYMLQLSPLERLKVMEQHARDTEALYEYGRRHRAAQAGRNQKNQSNPTLLGAEMNEQKLLERITVNPKIFGGKPIIRGRRLAVEHVLGMLAAGDTVDTILQGYPWLDREDIQACLIYARRLVGHERVEPMLVETAP